MPDSKQTIKSPLGRRRKEDTTKPQNQLQQLGEAPLQYAKREALAQKVAFEPLTSLGAAYQEIFGCSASTAPAAASRMVRKPEVAARIAYLENKAMIKLRSKIDAQVRCKIAQKAQRVAALQDRLNKMAQVIEERAQAGYEAPGAETGLLVKTEKLLGKGEDARIVEEYRVDTALLKEMRETEQQAAKELGQWVDVKDVTIRPEIEARANTLEC